MQLAKDTHLPKSGCKKAPKTQVVGRNQTYEKIGDCFWLLSGRLRIPHNRIAYLGYFSVFILSIIPSVD